MERKANFDYRNYFFPGPAFPVQVYPMGGNPHPAFPSSFGGAAANDLTSHVFPAFPAYSGEHVTDDDNSDSQGRRGSSKGFELPIPPHALVKSRNTPASLPPLQVDDALQGLHRQLDKAITFCRRCFDKHTQVVKDINDHAKKDARNSLWKGLLESRFDASDSERDLFHNISGRVEYCTQQIREAASADPSARSTSHDKRRDFERLVLRVKHIGVVCDKIASLSRRASSDRQTCEDMVDEMKTMKGLCKDDVGSLESNEGNEDNAPGEGETAAAGGW